MKKYTRYIHSGDFVGEEDLQNRSAESKNNESAADVKDSELAADAPSAVVKGPDGGEDPQAAEQQNATAVADADNGLSSSGQQDAEASDELGTVKQGGANESPAAIESRIDADVGVDAGATGYANEDLEASDGLGTADQEGTVQKEALPSADSSTDSENTETGTGTEETADSKDGTETDAKSEADAGSEAEAGAVADPDAESEAEADAGADADTDAESQADPAAGGESSAVSDARSSQRDTEASGEFGEEQPEPHKGLFAKLFGFVTDDDEETDPDSEADAGTDTAVQKTQGTEDKASGLQTGDQQSGMSSKQETLAPQTEESSPSKPDPLQQKRDNEQSDSLEKSVIYWQGNDKIPGTLQQIKDTLTEVMGLGSSFDVVFREMSFGGRRAALLCISGFAKDTIIDEILKRLTYLTPENLSTDVLTRFMSEYIPHIQVEKGELLSESINKVLSGMSVFFIEGETQVIVMDTRSYPSRSPDEPSIERVVRGARDGFTETLLSNVALVRRRIRDPGLKYEMHQVGRRTRTDVCVAYIDDIVDKTQVQAVTDKIKGVDIDGIPLADKQLEEAIVGGGWNPYPLVRYSERPDVVASHLLEGRVVVFVDTSPSVMILPTTFFDLCQHAEENRQTPFMGTYLRWVRFIGIFASMFLLPLWMLLVIHPELKPAMLEFIGPQKTAKIPLLAQFLIVELGVDLLRMAAVHTPTPLGSAMGLIAAILVGDIAVQTGLFVNEVVLYMAVASIGMFATPSYELGLANRIVRLGLLLAVAAFQVPGFVIGSTLLIVLLTTHRSYNSSYLWPFIPFNAKAMGEIILRQPVLNSKTRPSFNKTRDNTRMPPPEPGRK